MAAEKARAKESAEDTRKMIREAEAERIRRERFASNVAKGKEASGNAVETVPPAVFSSVGRLLDDGGGGGDGGSSPESNAEDSKPELATAFGIRNAPARETAKAIEKKTKEEARSAAVEAENETKKKLAAAREETRRRAERELKEIALAAEKRAAEALKEADRSRRREREELKIQRRREKESFAAAAEEREAWERAASKTRRDREKAAENERRIAERFEREKKNAEIRVVLEEGRKKKKERGRARVENAYPPANDRVRGGDVSRRRDAGTPTIEPERSTRSSGTLDRLGSAIVLVPGHWIDPGEETGSPGEREFNKAIADLTQAKLQGFGWTVIRPDLFSPPMRWREYADWASDRCAFGVPLLEIHGQGKDAAAIDGRITGVISQVGEDVSPLGDALAERFGRFPMDWRELLVSRVGGAVVESFETDYLESLGRRERERHMDGVAANIAEAVDSVKSRAKPAYGCSASGCPRDP
jgi:chemotaxis protein histidine kinase CheA